MLARNRAATACIDLSDGLADGVHRIARDSGVGITVEAEALPIDAETRAVFERSGREAVTAAIAGGDDYELLFTVRPRTRYRLRAAQHHAGVPLTRIGICNDSLDVTLARAGAAPQPVPAGYSHFGKPEGLHHT